MKVLIALLIILGIKLSEANPNGLGLTPPMGWNTWCTGASCHQVDKDGNYIYPYTLHDVCNEGLVKQMATEMKRNGMLALGYKYINLDDCWQSPYRGKDGSIQPDLSRFPYGMPDLIDWLHQEGFLFGLYNSAGWATCAQGGRYIPIIGSYGYYEQDAKTFASWGVDYLKMDWCDTTRNGTSLNMQTQTNEMAKALNATGRPIWFNFHCNHTHGNIPKWCQTDGNSYRIGPDHQDSWPSTSGIIYKDLPNLSRFAGVGHWNDPDFLMTGGAGCDRLYPEGLRCPGQTEDEYITEFTLWAITNSALIVAVDLRHMSDFQRKVLMNKELIDINQDTSAVGDLLGFITPCSGKNDCQIWGKPLQEKNSFAVALFNGANVTQTLTFDFKFIGQAGKTLTLRDLWAHKDLGSFTGSFSTSLRQHATLALKATW